MNKKIINFNLDQCLNNKKIDGEPDEIAAFFTELNTLASQKSDMPELMSILQKQTKDRCHIGHVMAFYQTYPKVAKAYLALLDRLMIHQPEKAVALLQQKNDKGFNLGYFIATYQTTAIQDYLKDISHSLQDDPVAALSANQFSEKKLFKYPRKTDRCDDVVEKNQ